MSKEKTQIREAANGYIKACWPEGCGPHQAIEIKLAFYAGMMLMVQQMGEIAESGDEEAALVKLEKFVKALEEQSIQLNEDRSRC